MFQLDKTIKAELSQTLDFTARLTGGRTLTGEPTVTVLSASAGDPEDLMISDVVIVDGKMIRFKVGGGTALHPVSPQGKRTSYCLRVVTPISSNETYAVDVMFHVNSCGPNRFLRTIKLPPF